MNVEFSESAAFDLPCDLLAIAIRTENDLDALNERLHSAVKPLLASRKFEPKPGQSCLIQTLGHLGAPQVLLLGVGEDPTDDALRNAAGKAGHVARSQRVSRLGLDFGALDASTAQQLIEAVAIGNYRYEVYKADDAQTPELESLALVGSEAQPSASESALKRARWQALARDLINQPAGDLYPETFADVAERLTELPNVSVEIWDEERLTAAGYVGILAVGQGSARPSRMIHIRYRPEGATAHIALVGKGVTFDSGGLSLKPSSGMQTMRCDMGGGATALGAVAAIADLGLPVAVDCIIGAVENMNDGNSYKLGDVLKYRNGVNVEIHNTDAEGRLVLADCLIHACEIEGVTHVVDLATLTGACVVAVGPDFTALFTDSDPLAEAMSQAAATNGEGLWRLPLHGPYKRMLKAEWGTIKNVGGRAAGSTTAALFLQHFVNQDKVEWAHLDIAGTAYLDKANGMYVTGGTGQMVRSLVDWAASVAR